MYTSSNRCDKYTKGVRVAKPPDALENFEISASQNLISIEFFPSLLFSRGWILAPPTPETISGGGGGWSLFSSLRPPAATECEDVNKVYLCSESNGKYVVLI